MTWWAIDVKTTAAERDALAAWLVGRTGQAVEEAADGTLVSFAADEAEADRLMGALRARYGASLEAGRRGVDEIDWSTQWRDGLGPRRIGRLLVTPSWIERGREPGGPLVVIDPEMAFGSGEHGSTRGALSLLERAVRPGDQVLDLGSGSGILAIAAVALGAARATGIEIDAEAVPVAGRNAERNGTGAACHFLAGDAGALAPLLGPVDMVLSNILRTVNESLLPAVRAALRPGGLAIFAGMEELEEPLFRPALDVAGFTVVDDVRDAGWWSVAGRRA